MTEASTAARRILTSLLEARTGQVLSPERGWRITAALKPLLAEFDFPSIDALVAAMTRDRRPELATRVVEELLNNETSFFRDAAVFDQIGGEAVRELIATRGVERRLRIWSAACSTGQEAYSLAMRLRDDARLRAWTVELHGTDISAQAIARAQAGRYTPFEIQRGLPVRTMLRWFEQDGLDWVAVPELRRAVTFATHDLNAEAPGEFDLILCRNVLMYFPEHHRRSVFGRMADALTPGGLLVLGAGETVIGQTDRFAPHDGLRGCYRRFEDEYRSHRAA